MKGLPLLCFLLFVAGVLLFLGQLWLGFMPPALFIKALFTDGALLFIVFVLNFLIKENKQTDKINHGDKLD